MLETDRKRLKEIRDRLYKVSRFPWANRGKSLAHNIEGGKTCVVGGKNEGMGESESLALVDKEADANFIIHAPEDVAWLIARLSECMVFHE